jgi:class III poly(R)-hydroxyalkanoic acid synthase PhaE subunit
MSNEFIEPWQKMMTEWQKTQASATKEMMANMQKWNSAETRGDNSYYNNNPILDIYQSVVKKFFDHSPQFNIQSSNDWREILNAFPGSDSLVKQMNEVLKGSKDVFQSLKSDFVNTLPDDETREYFLKTLEDISNPYSWITFSSTDFDEGVKRFSDGPLFSGVSDIDNRVAKAMDGWLYLGEKNHDYHEVLLKGWIKAYEKFLEQVKENTNEDNPELSPRRLVELWSSIASDELMSMHRSEEFLQVQKDLIKASAQYRLHEQDIAEVICEALHIPTRKEIDDVHKTITELRRELRALKKATQADLSNKSTTKKATVKKPKKTKS